MATVHEPTTVRADLSVWPASATDSPRGDLAVGRVPLAEIADRFGTPVHVLDEAEVRDRCRTYRDAFPGAEVLYAAKAFLCRAMAHWTAEEGLGLGVCSAGELELAVTTGFPPERIVLHGNAKSSRDLDTALRLGVGRIVIDSPSEIARLAAAIGPDGHQKVMVRVVPGIAGGHEKSRTGTATSFPGEAMMPYFSLMLRMPEAIARMPASRSWTSANDLGMPYFRRMPSAIATSSLRPGPTGSSAIWAGVAGAPLRDNGASGPAAWAGVARNRGMVARARAPSAVRGFML